MEGWYQRSMPVQSTEGDHEEEEEDDEEEEGHGEVVQVNYKEQYKHLKRKLKYLIFENECYQENLRASRAKLLEIARDRSFLLDRLLQYEKVEVSSSSETGEETESSDGEADTRHDSHKRKKVEVSSSHHPQLHSAGNSAASSKNPTPAKKKKAPVKAAAKQTPSHTLQMINSASASTMIPTAASTSVSFMSDGHMTPEEVERHLSARGHSFMELLPERAPPTVPTEMFSNEPSLDSESNELGDLETSPSNLGEDCLSVDMMAD